MDAGVCVLVEEDLAEWITAKVVPDTKAVSRVVRANRRRICLQDISMGRFGCIQRKRYVVVDIKELNWCNNSRQRALYSVFMQVLGLEHTVGECRPSDRIMLSRRMAAGGL